ncbi:hypothetical protein FVEN_g10011 [Fusarium venenatum]|uniref:uncharacterized protein n=1 Tax=Fusarium venenatum TaxID=56646 RepID=UPI001DF3476A|nr:hypothetical protein FVEN_g10011 [Fusarium venenatum]KAH6992060.1 hypothetical protein EDB82DRAFT_523169 [Fusarium venenatum]
MAIPEPVQRREDSVDYASMMMTIAKLRNGMRSAHRDDPGTTELTDRVLGMPVLQKLGFGFVASRRVERNPQPPSEHAGDDDDSGSSYHSDDRLEFYDQEPTVERYYGRFSI